MLVWLQGARWKLESAPFTQTPEWDCLGRSKIERDIVRTIDGTRFADATRESTRMIEIVSAPRQGKSLMLDRIGRHYLQKNWTVVLVTFNGPSTINMPQCPDDVSEDVHAIRELWSRVLAASLDSENTVGYSLGACRERIRNAGGTGGGGIGRLLGSAFGGRPVLLLIDEISVLTDKFNNLTSRFAEDLMTFLSPRHKLVYTTFDAKMSALCKTASGRVPLSFELPLLETEKQMRQLLPQKMALLVFCLKEKLPFVFLYSMLKSSPGTLGAILDPEAAVVPIFDLLANLASNHLWRECLRPYVEYSMTGKVASIDIKSAELFQRILGHKLGVDDGRRIVPVFLAVFVLSRNVDCFADDSVWACLHDVLVALRTYCGRLSTPSKVDNAKARGILFENYVRGSLLLRGTCSASPGTTTGACKIASCFSTATTDDVSTHTPIVGVTSSRTFVFSYPCISGKHLTYPHTDACKVLELRKETRTFYCPQGKAGNEDKELNKLLDGFYVVETADPNALLEYWIQTKNRTNCFGEESNSKKGEENYSTNFEFPKHVKSALENVDNLNSMPGPKVTRVVHLIVVPTVGSARRHIGSTTQYDLILKELKAALSERGPDVCAYELKIVSQDENETFGTYANLFSPVLAHFVPDSESFESDSWQDKHLCDEPISTVKMPAHLETSEGRIKWLADVKLAIESSATTEDLRATYDFDVEKEVTYLAEVRQHDMKAAINNGLPGNDAASDNKTLLAKCVVARAYATQTDLGIKRRIGRLV